MKAPPCLAFVLVVFPSLLPAPAQQRPNALVPVTDDMLANPDPADWLMWRRTLNSWGYSPLNQITRANVARLRMVWTRGIGPGVQEATPLVHNGVMFLPNPSDLLQAMNAATGELLWEYKRALPDDLTKHVPVPSINRNVAIYGNNIIDTSALGQTRLGTADSGLPRALRAGDLGPDRRARPDLLHARLRTEGRPRCLRHHGARRAHRQGNLADANHPEAGRAGQ